MFSVVIPSYNHARFINRCINSVLDQSLQDWELIVIDDGSSDNSNEIIADYALQDDRIRHVKQTNQGAHAAINRGLAMARGDFLTILNSDDEFSSDRFANCLRVFAAEPDLGLVSSWIDVIDAENNSLGVKMGWENMEPWPIANKAASFAGTDDYALNALMSNFVSTTSNMVFRRELYELVGGMRNLRFAHDWDFLLRACAAFKCKSIPEPLMRYRIHGNNTISSNRKWMLFEVCWVLAANLDLFASKLITNLSLESFKNSHLKMLESFNLQSNDNIFWILYWHINRARQMGLSNPEEIYLQDNDFRQLLLKFIQD